MTQTPPLALSDLRANQTDRQFVNALARGLAVAATFSRATEQSSTDIARALNLPQATVWRLCRTLCDVGYLVRTDGSDILRPGPPLKGLGQRFLSESPILKRTDADLLRLQGEFAGAVTVATRFGNEMLCLYRGEGDAVFSASTRPGSYLSLLHSSSGWAHLAALAAQKRDAVLKRLATDAPPPDERTLAAMDRAIAEFERLGYVRNIGILHPDINAVAVPVGNATNGTIHTISCGGISSAFDEPTLAMAGERLAEIARSLEEYPAYAASASSEALPGTASTLAALDPKSHVTSHRLFVTSLARGIQILNCFMVAGPHLHTTELAQLTGLAQPTVWRLCHTLRRLGHLVEAPGERLQLAAGVVTLGYATASAMSLSDFAGPQMRQLSASTGGTVTLGSLEGDNVVYLEREHGPAIFFSEFRVGARVPLTKSPTGWAILALMGEKEREASIARNLATVDAASAAATRAQIAKALDQYRETGFVASVGAMHPHLNAVSVPLPRSTGEKPSALTCGGMDTHFPPDSLAAIAGALKPMAALLSLSH